MKKGQSKRIQKLERHYGSLPIHHSVVTAAFETFRETGDLPEDAPLAYEVVQRARRGFDCVYGPDDRVDWSASIQAALNKPQRTADPTMDQLYDEAVWGEGMVRDAARLSLQRMAMRDWDPSLPQFAGRDLEIPDWGAVGIHFIGVPKLLAKPPYEDRAARLLARYAALRDRIPSPDRAWFAALERAVGGFLRHGKLPSDDLLRSTVLADGEFRMLIWNAAGEDVAEPMAALHEVENSVGSQREAAEARLQALANRGVFRQGPTRVPAVAAEAADR